MRFFGEYFHKLYRHVQCSISNGVFSISEEMIIGPRVMYMHCVIWGLPYTIEFC